MSPSTPITTSPFAANAPYDPKEGSSHPPAPPGANAQKVAEELQPALRWMRFQMVQEFIQRLRKKQRSHVSGTLRGRMRRRKAALALSAAAMGLNTAAIDTAPMDQPAAAVDFQLEDQIDATKERAHAERLTVSETMMEALAEEEGVRLTVYRDVAGYPTVGVGHLVLPEDNLKVGDRISYEKAIELLEQDLAKAEQGVRNLVGDLPLYQHEFDALVDLVYNVGEGNVSERKSPRLNAAINAGNYQAMADQLNYTTAAGKVARGLEYRSERRQAIFMEAAYEDPRAVEVDSSGRVNL